MMTLAMRDVLADPAAHDSLKVAIRAFADCDPVDAEYDAAHLAELMTAQVDDLQSGNPLGGDDIPSQWPA